MANDEKGIGAGALVLSFLAGAAIGTGIALLLAPRSGKETREKIQENAEEAVDKIRTYAQQAQERLKEAYEEGLDAVKDKKSVLMSAIEAGREAMERDRDKQKKERA